MKGKTTVATTRRNNNLRLGDALERITIILLRHLPSALMQQFRPVNAVVHNADVYTSTNQEAVSFFPAANAGGLPPSAQMALTKFSWRYSSTCPGSKLLSGRQVVPGTLQKRRVTTGSISQYAYSSLLLRTWASCVSPHVRPGGRTRSPRLAASRSGCFSLQPLLC